MEKLKCIMCSNYLSGNQRKYCSGKCKQAGHYDKHVKQNNNTTFSQYKRADLRKKELIRQMGGGCSCCGYNKNYSAIHFHHLRDKSFPLDSRNIGNRSLKLIKEEALKCILLCANCHAETHYPELLFN